jgi:hypothetical protein
MDRPLETLQAAADRLGADGGGRVAVAEGDYDGGLILDRDRDGVEVAGRCADLVTLTEDGTDSVVEVFGGASAAVSGLTVRGDGSGLYVWSAALNQETTLDARALVFDGLGQNGITVEGAGASLDARDICVQGGGADGGGLATSAVSVLDGGTAEVRGLRISGRAGVGLLSSGGARESTLHVEDGILGPFVDALDDVTVAGAFVQSPAELRLEGVWLDGALGYGLVGSGSQARLRLQDVRLTGVRPNGGTDGFGVLLQNGSDLEAEGLLIDGAARGGVAALGNGTGIDLTDTVIRGIVAGPDGWTEAGLALFDGPKLSATNLRIEDCENVGLALSGLGTEGEVRGLVVEGTRALPGAPASRGVELGMGAVATFRDVAIVDNDQGGVIALNTGTSVTIEGGVVRDQRPLGNTDYGGAGIGLQAGAVGTLADLVVEGNPMANVVVDGGHATLTDVVLRRPTAFLMDGDTIGRGLGVQGGGQVTLRRVVIDGALDVGLFVESSTVEAEDLRIERGRDVDGDLTGGRGASISLGSQVHLERAVIIDNQELGVLVGHDGTSLVLLDSEIRDTVTDAGGGFGSGLHVQEGAEALVERSLITGNHTVGVVAAHDGTRVELVDCEVSGTLPGADGSFGRGGEVAAGATLISDQTNWLHNHEVGVMVEHAGSGATFVGGEVRGTLDSTELLGGMGIVAAEDATVVAGGLRISGGAAPGIFVTQDGVLACTDCDLSGNAFGGAVVLDGELLLDGGVVEASPPHPEYGGGVGLFAWGRWGAPRVTVEGTSFRDLPGPAIYLREIGSYALRRFTTEDVATAEGAPASVMGIDAIRPWDGEDGLLLDGATLGDVAGDGVLLHRSGAEITGMDWGEVGGVQVHRQSCDENLDLTTDSSVTSVDDCLGPPRPILPRLLVEFETLDLVVVQ